MPILTLLDRAMLDTYGRSGFWRDQTIYDIAAAHAATRPDAMAVRDAAGPLSYAALIAAADALATDLAARSVNPGDRVAVWLPSRAEVAVALLACSRNGYVCCPSLHRDHTVAEIAALCRRMRATALVAQPGYGADAARADVFATIEGLRHAYAIAPGLRTGLPEPSRATAPAPRRDPNGIVYPPFTSGTTGQPKGVLHSDNTLLANARALSADWGFGPGSIIYTMSPLSHNLGLGALIAALLVGGELVVHDLPRGASLYDRIVETRATFLFGVPTHAIDLLTELRARGASSLGQVAGFRISGAAAPAEIVAGLMRHGVVPQSGFGMTAICSSLYTTPTDDPATIMETCGRACPGFEVRIFRQDDPDSECAPGELGQIGGRGASLMLGYFDDQAATEAAFNATGWFMTGDLGTLDAAGNLRITGRAKDLIIRGGHNIHPAQIEDLAMRHPAIARAAAFPVPDDRLGERACLAIVPAPGTTLLDDALLAHLDAAGLSRFDMPEFVLRLDALPLTPSGKTPKRNLVQRVRDGALHPTPVRFQMETANG